MANQLDINTLGLTENERFLMSIIAAALCGAQTSVVAAVPAETLTPHRNIAFTRNEATGDVMVSIRPQITPLGS